jgi:acetone carboxylase gamma subunit
MGEEKGDGVVMPLRIAHADVPDHLVEVDAVSERRWVTAKCTCGADFSRRKWLRSAEMIVRDIDAHLSALAPPELETEEMVMHRELENYFHSREQK